VHRLYAEAFGECLQLDAVGMVAFAAFREGVDCIVEIVVADELRRANE
jgi:hypothetical protein